MMEYTRTTAARLVILTVVFVGGGTALGTMAAGKAAGMTAGTAATTVVLAEDSGPAPTPTPTPTSTNYGGTPWG